MYRLERNSYNLKDNPHENRFDPIKLTQSWSNIRRIPSVHFQATKGRSGFHKQKEYQPDYDPNTEFGKRQLGSTGPPHASKTARPSYHYSSATNNEDRYNYNFYVRQTNSSVTWKKL